jgi:drug/metabolite transporter (DMT)-like permease
VSLGALALTLTAAIVHAAWNAALAGSSDSQAATAVALVCGAVAFLPVAVATWDVSGAAVPYAAASAAAETAYVALLAAAYARAEMSVVYPVARGAAPVLVLAVGGIPDPRQAAGVLAVAAGVVAVRGLRRPARWSDVGYALGVAACIATYTLIDARGLDHAAALPYLELVMVPAALAYAGALALRPGGAGRLRAQLSARTALAGAGLFGAYGLVLGALELAPAAAVAAVRETSVVFAVALAWLALHERVGRARLAGAVLVAAGVALVAA